MSSISVALAVSRAVELKYPAAEVLASFRPVAAEIVVNVDVGRPDGTLELVKSLLRPGVDRWLEEKWNWENREGGSEIAIQSNKAVEACNGDSIIYLQCDEMIHSDDYDYLKWLADTLDDSWAGIEFERLYFWKDLHTLRTDWTQPLVRMFRRGRGRVAGDGMNCEVDGKVWPVVRDGPVPTPALYHYSRVLSPGEAGTAIAKRIQTLDSLFHDPETIDRTAEYGFPLRTFDSYAAGTDPKPVPESVLIRFAGTHPAPARRLYGA